MPADPTCDLRQFKSREEQETEYHVSEKALMPTISRIVSTYTPNHLNSSPSSTATDNDIDTETKLDYPLGFGPGEIDPKPVAIAAEETDEGKAAKEEGRLIVTYPDGGLQAWSVVLGGFLMVFSGFGMTGSYGAFNTYYHNNNLSNYPLSVTAWIGSLQSFCVFSLAAVGGSLFDRFGPKPLLVFGTVVSVGGYIALSFCTQLWSYFLVQSVIIGIGMGAMFVCAIGAVADWFKERRGLATGIVVAGSSFGSIVWPIMIANLPQKVGWGWTVRIIAFIELFSLTSATLLIRTRLPRSPPKALFRLSAFYQFPAYLCMALSTFFFGAGFFIFLYFCGQYALEIGAGAKAPYVLIACNAASGLGRIFSGVIADCFGYYNVLIIETAIATLLMWVWMSIKSINALFALAVIYGIVTGGNIALQGVCVMQVTAKIGYTGTMIGQLYAAQSFALLVGPPISGYVLGTDPAKQMTNFRYAIIMNGGFLMLATGFAIASRLIQSRKILAKY